MNEAELEASLRYLVEKYAEGELQKELLLRISTDEPLGVKGILADLHRYDVEVSNEDGAVIREIVFHYV